MRRSKRIRRHRQIREGRLPGTLLATGDCILKLILSFLPLKTRCLVRSVNKLFTHLLRQGQLWSNQPQAHFVHENLHLKWVSLAIHNVKYLHLHEITQSRLNLSQMLALTHLTMTANRYPVFVHHPSTLTELVLCRVNMWMTHPVMVQRLTVILSPYNHTHEKFLQVAESVYLRGHNLKWVHAIHKWSIQLLWMHSFVKAPEIVHSIPTIIMEDCGACAMIDFPGVETLIFYNNHIISYNLRFAKTVLIIGEKNLRSAKLRLAPDARVAFVKCPRLRSISGDFQGSVMLNECLPTYVTINADIQTVPICDLTDFVQVPFSPIKSFGNLLPFSSCLHRLEFKHINSISLPVFENEDFNYYQSFWESIYKLKGKCTASKCCSSKSPCVGLFSRFTTVAYLSE